MASQHWPIEEAPGRDVRAPIPETFRLKSGERLSAGEVTGRLHGPETGPLAVVAGGVSSDRFAARWWSWAVRAGGPVDLDRVRVLAFDYLPGRDLAFAAAFPERIGRLVAISAAHRSHPAATAWRRVQRRLLTFASDCGREAEGVALARELAIVTYRTPEEFALRFAPTPPRAAGGGPTPCATI